MKTITLAASILSADFSHLADQIHEAEDAGVDWFHIDVMDGHFVPNITMGPFIVETCRKITKLPLDIHLMIEKPELFIDNFANAGADSISVHFESNPNINRSLQKIREMGKSPAVVINPGTPVFDVVPSLPFVDHVLIMSVNPGYSGQKFIPNSLEKVGELHSIIAKHKLPVRIEVDGGINSSNVHKLAETGMDIAVVASAIFSNPKGISLAVKELREAFGIGK